MKESYAKSNNISDEKADVVKMILDSNYAIMGSKNQESLVNVFDHERKNPVTSDDLQGINDWEINQSMQWPFEPQPLKQKNSLGLMRIF
jgi:hypothetical protein